MQNADKYYLMFEERKGCGPKEQFFHFLWGYLLPSVYFILKIRPSIDRRNETKFVFCSCGAVMDVMIDEMAEVYDFKYSIEELRSNQRGNEVVVPRWDLFLIYYTAYLKREYWVLVKNFIKELVIYKKRPQILKFKRSTKEILDARTRILERLFTLDSSFKKVGSNLVSGFYILERSKKKKIKNVLSGRIEVYTFPKTHKTLIGIESSVKEFHSRGIDMDTFEPGQYSLKDQVKFFYNCSGVLAIRSAELANILWMKAESKVIVLNFYKNGTSSPSMAIAKIFNLEFTELKEDVNRKKMKTALIDKICNILKQ